MKKVIILALFIGFALTNTSCNSDKKAQAINEFVRAYFPDTEVIANIKDGLDCDVTLSDYTQIEFDGNIAGKKLEWDEVNCKHSTVHTAVPAALIPTEIADYVSRLHSEQRIVKIAKDFRGWEIELSNGIEIEFDSKFRVREID
jgi:hypothetical protein